MNFYVNKKDFKQELESRKHLKEKVEIYWSEKGHPLPNILLKSREPFAFCTRHVATARNESFSFYKQALEGNLIPLWSEYLDDIFISISKPKLSLVYPKDEYGKRLKLNNPALLEKKIIKDIQTKDGKNIVQMHHDMWDQNFKRNGVKSDFSNWLKSFKNKEDYYLADLSICLAHGILFKDYHGESKLSQSTANSFLTKKVFEPAFKEVFNIFGHTPLVYQFSYEEGFDLFPGIQKQFNQF